MIVSVNDDSFNVDILVRRFTELAVMVMTGIKLFTTLSKAGLRT